MATDKPYVELDPKKVLVVDEDNPRYGAPADIAPLMESIKAEGGINTPVEVEPLVPPVNGHTHKLTVGFRRYQALTNLNKEGAGLMLPAIVRTRPDELARLHTQIVENWERRNLSPMDLAVAIKKLMDLEVPRVQIREMFPRPTTGKKKGGTELAPASNAWVNMTLSFLELPKDIREKIHDGRIGTKAAYLLTRVAPDKRAAVLERAEKERAAEIDAEAAEEKKYLAAQEKLEKVEKEEEETVIKIDHAKAEVELAAKAVELAQKKAADLYTQAKTTKDKDARKKVEEAFKAAETDAKGQERKLTSAQKELDKLAQAKEKVSTAAAEARTRLEEAAKAQKAASKAKPGTVSSGAVAAAAKAEGDPSGHVRLKAEDMRKFIDELSLTDATYPRVALIGKIIKEHFEGGPIPGVTIKKLAAVTGELKAPAPRAAKAK